ncbi:hypothetical protein [Falsihalocynthiibacter arcticus]|uniref:Uncharacterized protein n=1 Tax=Falsihalocynthiibacter arcticus TaxID=1579316 RepID=A0A126V3C0_9RHOB|nr:hypothetical protein [Falsihalocynthiibacter arcticus]AML52814.1 hypothetical protein RC74_17510 [Falsihalocynthiibacter arcticus]
MYLSDIPEIETFSPQTRACLSLFGHAAGGLNRVLIAEFDELFPEAFEKLDPQFNSRIPSARVYKLARKEVVRILAQYGYRENPWEFLRMLIRDAGERDTIEHAWGGLKTPAIAAGLRPADITAAWVWSLEAEAKGGNSRLSLRRGARVFDQLFEIPSVVESGILPPKRIGAGPRYRKSGDVEAVLPPKLAQVHQSSGGAYRSAISGVWRAILAAEITVSVDPSLEEIGAVIDKIVELPAALIGVSESTWKAYLCRIGIVLQKNTHQVN